MATADWLTTAPRGIRTDGVYRGYHEGQVLVLQFHALKEPFKASCVSLNALPGLAEYQNPVCDSTALFKDSPALQFVRPIGGSGWLAGDGQILGDQFYDNMRLQ